MKYTICTFLFTLFIGYNHIHAQQNRPLSSFTHLEVTDKINVKVVPADRNYLEVHGDLTDKFELVQQGQTLRLKMALGYQLQGNVLHVTLYHTDLWNLTARKGAVIASENQTLRADSIYLSSSEGSSIGLTIESDRLGINSTTGGNIQLAGKANKQTASISLGGLYHAKSLTSQTANLTVTGGGRAEINASQSVDLQTRAGGVIDVYGNPRNTKERKFAGGRITYFK